MFRKNEQHLQMPLFSSINALPAPSLPEIAIAGRSNCGKSSFINMILRRKAMARTSNTPGRTRLLNFFRLAERLLLVDLPGVRFR